MSNILPSKVAEGGFTRMLERLGRDCGPTQFIREFVFNGIEAILRVIDSLTNAGNKGLIVVDVDWLLFEERQIYKLCFIDNGVGMTGEEMLKFIKDLSSTGASNKYENYGMGAKIAALTRNKAGLIYQSWKNGQGYQVVLRYDEKTDQYGCAQQSIGDGEYSYWVELDESVKPPEIEEHGTKVTLFGNSFEEDTVQLPENVKMTRESWLFKTINERFFQFPDNIDVKVRVGYDRPRSNTKHNFLLIARGQKRIFEEHSSQFGTTELSDAKVYWYILKDDASGHGRHYVQGNTALIHQDEIFDRTDGRTSRAALFGILFGATKVVLLIEPQGDYNQTIQRTSLIRSDGKPISWERWGDEFKSNMPNELHQYVQNLVQKASKDSHSDSINERLKKLSKFYKVSRYKPFKDGSHEVDPDIVIPSKTGHLPTGDNPRGSGSSGGGSGLGNVEELLAVNIKAKGVKARETKPDPFPRVDWISVKDGTRGNSELEDRAATYISSENLIKANKDFQGFTDVVEHFLDEYRDFIGAAEMVPDVVFEWFEQQLVESVAGILSMKNRKYWTHEDIETALSEEALTASIMQRFHLFTQVKRNLSSKLGKPSLDSGAESL